MGAPLANPLEEAARAMDAATASGLAIRLTGGVAIASVSPTGVSVRPCTVSGAPERFVMVSSATPSL